MASCLKQIKSAQFAPFLRGHVRFKGVLCVLKNAAIVLSVIRRGNGLAANRSVLTFWGVRGGIPAPGGATKQFGGNSPCVEVNCGDRIVVFDAGTGLRVLGQSLMARSPVKGDLLFSHTNFNRICGLPFFAAAFHPKNNFAFWCGHRPEEGNIQAVLTTLMTDPVFPVPIDIFNAQLSFHDFPAGTGFALDSGIEVASIAVSCGLPGTSYKVHCTGGTIGYACALTPPDDLTKLVDFVTGCDILILSFVGHDPDRLDAIAAEVAERAGIGQLIVTDHAPEATDDDLLAREEGLMNRFSASRLAREGDCMQIGEPHH
tara:strand:- start:6745 stop:7692 length:948 start_codon:yes stop_codon:yes gene_type:complete